MQEVHKNNVVMRRSMSLWCRVWLVCACSRRNAERENCPLLMYTRTHITDNDKIHTSDGFRLLRLFFPNFLREGNILDILQGPLLTSHPRLYFPGVSASRVSAGSRYAAHTSSDRGSSCRHSCKCSLRCRMERISEALHRGRNNLWTESGSFCQPSRPRSTATTTVAPCQRSQLR